MTERPLPTAILGASGYIGQHFARLLAEHPDFGPPRLVSTERSGGKRLSDVWQLAEAPPASMEEARLEPLSVGRLVRSGVRVFFSALPSGTAGPIESELTRRGAAVFTNAADHRFSPRVPLLGTRKSIRTIWSSPGDGPGVAASWSRTRTARPRGWCSRSPPSSGSCPLVPCT